MYFSKKLFGEKFQDSLLFLVICALLLLPVHLYGKEEQNKNINTIVLKAVVSMPSGGGYSTSSLAMKRLSQAVTLHEEKLVVVPSLAEPSFCSEATYLVFLKTLLLLQEDGRLVLTPELLSHLQAKGQSDGQGIWGRWNANGPGAARLFYTLKLGPNFTNLAAAQPGDFLKLFWTDSIGAAEHGHLVVYLGTEKKEGIDYINCWSSNKPNGYGKKSYRQSSIHRMIFSRLTNPQNILNAPTLPNTDFYLASLLSRSSSLEGMKRSCGVSDAVSNAPAH